MNESTGSAKLTESYVKDHYNSGLRKMEEEYIDRRWFSSVEARFDYRETKRALEHALGRSEFQRAVEVGPGDGVWTRLFASRIKTLTLFDQSEEMLKRAKKALAEHSHIDYQLGNFATADIGTAAHDLFISIRCFEYVVDKDAGVEKIADSLVPGGKMILITKNPNYRSAKGWKPPLMHTEQVSKRDMISLLTKHGLCVDAVYPAVYRWKSSYAVFRAIFNVLQWLTIATDGRICIPYITDWSTESYTFVAHKPGKVIELYGLPGSGKSTLARELEAKDSLIKRYRPQRWGRGLFYFITAHPGTFCFWMKEFMLGSLRLRDWKFFRYRLAILLNTFEAVGRAYRAAPGYVILEEGLVQRIVGLYERPLSAEEFRPLLRRIPHLETVVMVEGDGTYFTRYEHSDNPRGQRGEEYMKQFKEMLLHNHTLLVRELQSYRGLTAFTYARTDSLDELKIRILAKQQ